MEIFISFVCENEKKSNRWKFSMLARMVRRCCEIKAGVVERDPKEQGERATAEPWSYDRTCSRKINGFPTSSWSVCRYRSYSSCPYFSESWPSHRRRVSGNYQGLQTLSSSNLL